ncbi:MAG: YdcF family protein [Alphaproteobacteria bacterium]|nr:YdcF family protein [Alphaproteobacteria bacterium]
MSGVGKNISLDNIQKTQNLTFPESANINIGHLASNTIGNAKETQIWVKENHINSIRLVTSNYHIYRSMIEFREQIPNLKIIPHPVFSENIEKKWWTSWQTCSLIFKEYNKLLYAYIRTKIN